VTRPSRHLGAGDAVAVVLAAGAGRRFGRPKALARIDGERFVDRAVRVLRAGGCADVVVVAGAVPLSVRHATVVENAQWASGQASSLRMGLAAATGTGAGAAVLALVDTPWVGPDAVSRVISAWAGGASAVVATYDGHAGHPVLVDRQHWDGVAATASGDEGARRWLAAHRELVAAVDCTGTGWPDDVDEPADLSLRAGGYHGPLSRARGGVTTAMLGAGLQELEAFTSGTDARRQEQQRQAIYRQQQQSGDPPFGVDLDAGVVVVRRRADAAGPG
jgi:nicotine blue oxidoreductase